VLVLRFSDHPIARISSFSDKVFLAMPKPLFTLHIIRNELRGSETTYTVTRFPSNVPGSPETAQAPAQAQPQAPPQSWGRLKSVLGQVARIDPAKLSALKKDLDAKGSIDLPNIPLDSFDLRLIGFTEA
jgi:hypothetical protein